MSSAPASLPQLFTVPSRVYAATDGVPLQWRFLLVILNLTAKSFALRRVVQTRVYGTRRARSVQTGTSIRGIIQGTREIAPNAVLVLEVQDSTAALPPPQEVEVDLEFARGDGSPATMQHRVALEPRATLGLHFPLVGEWLAANARPFRHCLGRQFGFDLLTPADQRFNLRKPRRSLSLNDCTSFGQVLLSPARGVVTSCADEFPDIPPKPCEMPAVAPSNHVALAAESGEHVYLAHLRQGSLRVTVGDAVEAGQPLAEVGNSGTTSQPHLHIEVLDRAPEMDKVGSLDFTASGVPFGFHVQGQLVVPRRGQVLCSTQR